MGVNLSELPSQNGGAIKPAPLVHGRVAHIDADFLAYMVAYKEDLSISEMHHNINVIIEKLRLMSGAETVKLHLTPSGSTKGNRDAIALQKEYQGSRKNRERPEMLHAIRDYMHKELGAILCPYYEADDSMAMYQTKAITDGTPELSVIISKDKDLAIVPGLQMNWDTGEMTDTGEDPFGWIEIQLMGKAKKTKKVKGRGWKFFWAQLLMGDSADDIVGLPKCIHDDFTKGKLKPCGPVLTYNILENITNNKDAFELAKELFKATGEKLPYKDYRDPEGVDVPYSTILISEMKLLWMRRHADENDVLKWLKETAI